MALSAKHIRENNYLWYRLDDDSDIVALVLSVYEETVDLYRGDERYYKVPISRVHPIPLDQNWLDYLGYVPHPKVPGYLWIPKYTAGYMSEGCFYVDHNNGYIFKAYFVHDLQNTVSFILRNNIFGPKRIKNPEALPDF